MDFSSLVGHINNVQEAFQAQAAHAINLSLTARNWLVGYEIETFIQKNSLQIHNIGNSLIWRTVSAELEEWATPPTKLFNRLNFSSLLYLTNIDMSSKFFNNKGGHALFDKRKRIASNSMVSVFKGSTRFLPINNHGQYNRDIYV